MPHAESPTSAALEALGFALFLRDDSGSYSIEGKSPAWLQRLWPDAGKRSIAELSPFLENFIVDATQCWRDPAARLASGPWTEQDRAGAEVELEATALTVGGRSALLIERMGEEFAARKSVLQKARETVIANHRLNAEVQKKDILLHCFAEDLSGTLANIITALRLIEIEQDPVRTRQLVHLATLATREQQSLIGRVLDVFGDELASFYGRNGNSPSATDLTEVARAAVAAVAQPFSERGVRLNGPAIDTASLRVTGHAAHLERVVINLLENALAHSNPGSTVTIALEAEEDGVLLRIDDQAPALSPEVAAQVFARLEPASAGTTASILRLHFCRITVENCHGEIGCNPSPSVGNRFWIRIPRSTEIS